MQLLVAGSVRDLIPDAFQGVVWFSGYTGINSCRTLLSGSSLSVFWIVYVFLCQFQYSWLNSSVVPTWVVFCEIFCQIFLTCLPEYVEMVLSHLILHLIKYHIYRSGLVFFFVPFPMLCTPELYVATGFGDCVWPISSRGGFMEVSVGSFQTVLIIQILCQRPWRFAWCWIPHV